ncbi:MAG TPA: GNAT family N-acetyltransferase [Acidobacteriaceae bacterium]
MIRPGDSPPAGETRFTVPRIRRMTPGDLPAVIAIAGACPETPRWRPADYTAYADPGPPSTLLRVGFVALVAGAPPGPDSVMGFAAASLLDESGRSDADSRCDLESMAVLPDVRRQGIGGALLRAVLTWASEHQARRCVLEVRAGNTAALALYQRFGLRQQGRRPRYYTDPPEDALLLGMPVTGGSATPSFSTEKAVEGGPPRC